MVDIDDPRPYAHMVQSVREKGMSSAYQVAMINLMSTMYESMGDIPEEDFEVDLEEAEQIMSELPTTYEDEESRQR